MFCGSLYLGSLEEDCDFFNFAGNRSVVFLCVRKNAAQAEQGCAKVLCHKACLKRRCGTGENYIRPGKDCGGEICFAQADQSFSSTGAAGKAERRSSELKPAGFT